MRHKKNMRFALLFCFLISAAFCGAYSTHFNDGYSPITIHEAEVQGVPRTNSIQATIDGHYLSVVFLENLGQVTVEVSSNNVGEIETQSTPTPNGVIIYIPTAGSYIVTFTLANGDVYYGEFEVVD